MQCDLDRARQLLGLHRSDQGELAPLAERLAARAERHPEQAGELHFLAGSIYARIAEREPTGAVPDAWNNARSQLEEAQTLGVAEADFLRLTYLLAKAWSHTGGDLQEVIDYLERSIEGGADQPAEGYALLADAYLRLPQRDVPAALAATEKELALPYVDERLLAPARLLRGELLLELKRTDEARKALANIGILATPPLLARARFLCALSFQEEEHWADAESLWKQALDDRAAPPREPAQILYYLGICYRKQDQSAEAARAFAECAERGDAGDAGPAALVQLAELRLAEPDPTSALDSLERAVRDVASAADWHNPLVDLSRVRDVFDSGCELFRKQGRFDQALRLARLYEPFALDGAAQAQFGRTAYEWGQHGLAAARAPRASSAALEEARAHFHQAGEAFEKAGVMTSAPADQVDRSWLAVESYAEAKDAARTISAVKTLIELSRTLGLALEPQQYGKAWFVLAEAYHAEGQETLAQHAFGECINFHSLYAYRARCRQAAALVETGKIDEARGILEQNLRLLHEEDNPDREAQERTLYGLARLLYDSRDYSAAVTHYKQALEKFGDNAEAIRARFDLAECYRELASQEVKASAPGNRLTPDAAKHHDNESRRYLRLAVEKYQEVAEGLGKRAGARALSAEEDWLYWQAQVLLAGCRHSFGEYTEAQKLYQQLAARYQGKAQELYALHGVAGCYWSRGAPGDVAKAGQTVEAMRTLLAKLSDADLAVGPDSWDRKKWEDWLQRVSKTPGKP
jgi:hypothetical protein